MKTAIYTIVSNNYLHFARTLLQSVRVHHPDCRLYCVIVDSDALPARALSEEFEILSLRELALPEFDQGTSPARTATRRDEQLDLQLETIQRELQAMQRRHEEVQHKIETQVQQLHKALSAIHNSRSWRITAPLRQLNAVARATIGRLLRAAVRWGKALARRVPVVKSAAVWLLRSSPFLARQVTRFSAPQGAASALAWLPIRDFEHLRSVRIMRALDQFQESDGPVTFLQVSDEVN